MTEPLAPPPRSPGRRGVVLGAGALALAAGVGWQLWRHRLAPTANEDLAAFLALELPTPSGARLPLRSLAGRPLVINFWATWCPPCVKEMPELDRFARDFASRGWQVLGVAIDKPQAVSRFLTQTPVGFPIVLLEGTEGLTWIRRLGNPGGGLPFSLQLAANGSLQQTKLGPTTLDELRGWTQPA
ncbi:TlpA disulfide reductase family protein [Ideonella sp.]|uniref:TlpA disulfide reductase family protein n=1 Tax=Ideonella sp. TaxID=1929293 RepID=UPI0035B37EF5